MRRLKGHWGFSIEAVGLALLEFEDGYGNLLLKRSQSSCPFSSKGWSTLMRELRATDEH